MNLQDNGSCDFFCEWFDFLRTWVNNESEDRDDCQGAFDCRINSTTSDASNEDDDETNSTITILTSEQKPRTTNVTCFNCDDNFLFFGTNTGWIYCFPRGERQAKGPLYEHHPVKCQIIGIEIPDENVVSLLLPNGFIMFNFVRNEIIYSWSIERSKEDSVQPLMVTSKCIYDHNRHRYHVFTGDSVGTVRCHNVIEDETVTIFCEEQPNQESDQQHCHAIVQIDVYNSDLLAVSSCFRSLILWKSISDSWSVIQIGRNVRKICGQYGAIFHQDGNTLIASRPAMHLIKANTTDGSVVQTFKLKNVAPLKTLNLFKESIENYCKHSKPTTTATTATTTTVMSPAISTLYLNGNTNVFNFGYLMPIQINDDDYICSWNSHSLFIIKTDGTLLVKEYSSVKIIGANVSQTRGFRDVIILREDWTLFRIRFMIKRDYIKSKVTDYSLGEVLRGTLGQNLTSLPTQALSSLEGEIKKIYTLMSDKIYESGEKLLNYTSFDQLNILRKESSLIEETQVDHSEENSTLYNDQDCYSGDLGENFDDPPSPLYIHKKISRKNSVNSRFQFDLTKSGQNLPFSTVSHKSSSSMPDVNSMQDGSSTAKDGPKGSNYDTEDDGLQTNKPVQVEPDDLAQDDDNDTAIEQSSFNGAQSKRNASCSTVESFSLDGLELTKKFNQSSASSYGAEIKSNMIREGENIFGLGNISSSDDDEISKLVDSDPITVDNVSSSLISSANSLEDNNSTDTDSLDNLSEITIPMREPRPIKHVDWQLAIENTHNSRQLEINRFCASGFSDTETSTYVWLSCASKNRPKLVYYPDFESLRLPPGNNKSFTVAAIRNKIYLLNSENELWYREGVDEPGLAIGPALGLATRWNKISKPKSAPNFVNLSLCSSDQLGWFCDTQGDVWLNKLRTESWFKISHDSDNRVQVRSIEICPTDSSMVWCIDDQNQLFVRAGIFNTRGDSDEHIAGMAWIPVHTPVEATSIAVTNTSVWILSDRSNSIFKRIGIQPPSSYVGTDWQEIKSPTLINDSLKDISASLNGDIWLLTQQGSIWQVCDP